MKFHPWDFWNISWLFLENISLLKFDPQSLVKSQPEKYLLDNFLFAIALISHSHHSKCGTLSEKLLRWGFVCSFVVFLPLATQMAPLILPQRRDAFLKDVEMLLVLQLWNRMPLQGSPEALKNKRLSQKSHINLWGMFDKWVKIVASWTKKILMFICISSLFVHILLSILKPVKQSVFSF